MKPEREASLEAGMGSWMGAVIGTMALNLLLFAVILHLMQPADTPRRLDTPSHEIHLTRVKRQEPPPPEKKDKPQPNPREQKPSPKPLVNRPAFKKLALPFEVNTRLPQGPHILELPSMASGALDSLDLSTHFDPGDLDTPLTVLTRMPPIYPTSAKARGIEGWVRVRFVVTEQGHVDEIRIISAEPRKIFDASVIQCVSAWRFKPGCVGGVPVKTRVETRILFELD